MIAWKQIAEVLIDSLTSSAATRKMFELVAEKGPAPQDLDPLFAALDADPAGSLDGVHDTDNQPLEQEPADVRAELEAVSNK